MKIADILSYIDTQSHKYEFEGNTDSSIVGFAPLNSLSDDSISWIRFSDKFDFGTIQKRKNVCIVCQRPKQRPPHQLNYIFCDTPEIIFFDILKKFFCQEEDSRGIKPDSIVESKDIDATTICVGHHCHISEFAKIGKNVVIRDNVSILGKVEIGDNCIISSNVTIGEMGFGFYKNADGINMRMSHVGGVVIGSNVEVGAGCTICRGTMSDTTIDDNTKIDGNTYIAHNCKIGKNCEIQAGVVISGSVNVGDGSLISASSTVVNYKTIGEGSYIGMHAFVKDNIPPGAGVVAGHSKCFPNAAKVLWGFRLSNISKK